MTRYFYTDPLAAAWMAKYHGIKFANGDSLRSACEAVGRNGRNIQHVDSAFHVHPDSLHLLKPIPTLETPSEYIHRDLCHVNHRARDYYGSYHECLGFCGGMDVIRIIQRNGIPFMWPEQEA